MGGSLRIHLPAVAVLLFYAPNTLGEPRLLLVLSAGRYPMEGASGCRVSVNAHVRGWRSVFAVDLLESSANLENDINDYGRGRSPDGSISASIRFESSSGLCANAHLVA